jgi:excisionase family DNA binding protein
MPDEFRMLTVDEVAAALRLSLSATYALIRSGVLPATHIGRRIRVAERVLENFIEAGGRAWPGGWRKRPADEEHAA